MEELNSENGVIRKEFVAYCATCTDMETLFVDTFEAAEKLARMHGWSDTEQYGWICPACVAKRKSGQALNQWECTKLECTLPGG